MLFHIPNEACRGKYMSGLQHTAERCMNVLHVLYLVGRFHGIQSSFTRR